MAMQLRTAVRRSLLAPRLGWLLLRRLVDYVRNSQEDLEAMYGDRPTRRAGMADDRGMMATVGSTMAANITSGSGVGF